MSAAFWFIVSVTSTAFLTFLSFVIWFEGRQKEREAHYRDEMARKIAEAEDSRPILEYVRANEQTDAQRVKLKVSIRGLVTSAVGAALMIFLYMLVPTSAVYLIGLFPLFVGIVLLSYSGFMMKPRA